jgi:thioredoxin reductase (NADPH)
MSDFYTRFGDENVDVYHTTFKPLEWNFLKSHQDNLCYVKLIVNKADNERVIGLHYAGPNAGEVMQGYAVAVTAGLTKEAWDNTIGIHPTTSEELVILDKTKREFPNVEKAGC